MAYDPEFGDWVADHLSGLGPIEIKRMFGAAGVKQHGAMFAILDDGVIWLKATGDLSIKEQPAQRYDDDIAKGTVIGTSPAAGAKVTSDQPITIIVSRGPPSVDVPDIAAGTPLDDAKKTLRDKGFKTDTTEQFSDTVEQGTVISVSPSDTAIKGSTITITVSRGPEMIKVPAVSNESVDTAEQQLKSVGLVPRAQSITGGEVAGDARVLLVRPGAGETVRVGSTVTLYVV